MSRLLPACVAAASLLAFGSLAYADSTQGLVRARNKVFGAEHVNQKTGEVEKDKVIFSWLTNATLAASLKGKVIMLDTYVHRAETVPGRTPFVVEDLLALKPEAIFIGHGHGDHADNAAWLGGKLQIPIFASTETCADFRNLDLPHLIDIGALKHGTTLDCHDVTSYGSTPGSEIVKLNALEPVAAITAFRHLHSGVGYPETRFPIVPVRNEADPRDPEMYPPGTPHSYPTLGTIGGEISIYYQFRVHGDNEFTFVWHNTSGDLNDGCTIQHAIPNCWDDTNPGTTQAVKKAIRGLSETDLEFGSFVSLGYATTGMRDPIQNTALLKPKIWVPIHQTNAALPTSSLWFKVAYLQQLQDMQYVLRADQVPENRWMVDPDDYLKPMVFDPADKRWIKMN